MKVKKTMAATNLREDLYDTLKKVSGGDSLVITHKQGDPVVLLSQDELNKIVEENEVLRQIAIGATSLEKISHADAVRRLRKIVK
jgi:PHD/YefM family antitoxin component YafN of YafNO toxin-antitoxin module